MEKIILNDGNRRVVADMLQEAQKSARARTISINDIYFAGAEIERKLGITKKALEGTSASVDLHAQNFPNAYNGIPESTIFEIIYERGVWRLVKILRCPTRRERSKYKLVLSDAATAAVIESAQRLFVK